MKFGTYILYLIHITSFSLLFSVTKRAKNVLSEIVSLTELSVIKVQLILYCFVDLDMVQLVYEISSLANLSELYQLGRGLDKLLLGVRPIAQMTLPCLPARKVLYTVL